MDCHSHRDGLFTFIFQSDVTRFKRVFSVCIASTFPSLHLPHRSLHTLVSTATHKHLRFSDELLWYKVHICIYNAYTYTSILIDCAQKIALYCNGTRSTPYEIKWIERLLSTIRELYTESYTQRAIHRELYTESYTKRAIHRELYTESYTQRAIQRELYTESYTQRAIHRELYITRVQLLYYWSNFNSSNLIATTRRRFA